MLSYEKQNDISNFVLNLSNEETAFMFEIVLSHLSADFIEQSHYSQSKEQVCFFDEYQNNSLAEIRHFISDIDYYAGYIKQLYDLSV